MAFSDNNFSTNFRQPKIYGEQPLLLLGYDAPWIRHRGVQ